jgi:uncharacterized protein
MGPVEPSESAEGSGQPVSDTGADQPRPALHIEVVFCPGPRQILRASLQLPWGCAVSDALVASALIGEDPVQALKVQGLHLGVWGRKAALGGLLREGDRVEIYRPLTVDPKEARRVRYRAQGEKLPKGIHRSPVRSQAQAGTNDMTPSSGQQDPG